MLTKNFYSYMKAAFLKMSSTFTTTEGATKPTALSSDIPPFKAMNVCAYNLLKAGTSFGTGSTQATPSDYYLKNALSSSQISVSEQSAVSYSQSDTYDEYTATFGVTNITAEAIAISEVGLTANPYSDYYVLVDRTVLDTPVTIPAGQSKQITYTIRFNY